MRPEADGKLSDVSTKPDFHFPVSAAQGPAEMETHPSPAALPAVELSLGDLDIAFCSGSEEKARGAGAQSGDG